MDLALKIEGRNNVLEKLKEERVSKTLKTYQCPKWISWRPNTTKPIVTSKPSKTNTASNSNGSRKHKGGEGERIMIALNNSREGFRRLTEEE
ncbi:uncharacterized protein G2W53_022116 [Senna tora]|uniref:Uncharacterized protein n=1 Tax=Senna tora TaxID=362788 RepID=A0A834WIF9_9FABA|nr:uncharacterized protein G2W53_022116 [Senna tora]